MQDMIGAVVVVRGKQGSKQSQGAFVMVVSRWLAMIVFVRQPDIEMIAIGFDGDVVVVAMLRQPQGGGDGGRLEIDEK